MQHGNLSLEGQTDYIETLINQSKINEFLVNLKKHNVLEKMEKDVQERRTNGTLTEHKPTHWEKSNKKANELISEHPNAVSVAERLLNENHRFFKVTKGDEGTLKKARLIEIVAITKGRQVTRTTDAQGNKILKIDEGRAKSK